MTTLRTLSILAFTLISPVAWASGSHEGGHYSFGAPGKPEDVTRTITVEAVDAEGEMRFIHEPFTLKQGEVVKFIVTNKGELEHEFTVGDSPSQRAHALMMEKMPDMKHENDAAAITLAPGETKELIWAFTKPIQGQVEFACQIPGHYQGGMVSKVKMVQ